MNFIKISKSRTLMWSGIAAINCSANVKTRLSCSPVKTKHYNKSHGILEFFSTKVYNHKSFNICL